MTRLALLAAVLSAWLLARRAPQHRPIARALSLLLAIDVARLATAGATEGLAFRVDVALTAGWYVAMTGAVLGSFAKHLRWVDWIPCLATIVAAIYLLDIRGDELSETWRGTWIVSTAAQLFTVAVYAARDRKVPGAPETVALILAAGSLADLAGPWCRAHPVGSVAWEIGRWQSAATWAIVTGAQIARWVKLRPRP